MWKVKSLAGGGAQSTTKHRTGERGAMKRLILHTATFDHGTAQVNQTKPRHKQAASPKKYHVTRQREAQTGNGARQYDRNRIIPTSMRIPTSNGTGTATLVRKYQAYQVYTMVRVVRVCRGWSIGWAGHFCILYSTVILHTMMYSS